MIITISGTPGSGKSTAAENIAKKMKFRHYSTGNYMRKMAEKRGISLLELGRLAEKDKSIDKELDRWQKELGEKKDNLVIDARLGFYFIPDSIKVFIDADIKERARRIYSDKVRKETNISIGDAMKKIKQRQDSERKRYKKYYGIDPWKRSNFDQIVDSTKLTKEEVVENILNFIKNKKL